MSSQLRGEQLYFSTTEEIAVGVAFMRIFRPHSCVIQTRFALKGSGSGGDMGLIRAFKTSCCMSSQQRTTEM